MAVDLLTELLFSVTNSLDILKGIFFKFLCVICVNIVKVFIFNLLFVDLRTLNLLTRIVLTMQSVWMIHCSKEGR